MTLKLNRRGFLRRSGTAALALGAGPLIGSGPALAQSAAVRIASNPGLENATLNELIANLGLFDKYGVNAEIVEAPGATGPYDAIIAGAADICMVSGFNRVLPRIESGANVRIVGAGMRKTALTVYAKDPAIKTLHDLPGRSFAVGPEFGLLHALMLQLCAETGIDKASINFVDKGSNANVYKAILEGEAEAGLSSISSMLSDDGLHLVEGGNIWEAVPGYTFQTAYADATAITERHEGMVAILAAYGALYDFLMSPESKDAFMDARRAAQKKFDEPSARATWEFNQSAQPYSKDLTMTEAEIDYLQTMFVSLGMMKAKLPFEAVAEMSIAREAAARLA